MLSAEQILMGLNSLLGNAFLQRSNHIETRQLICESNKLAGFYIVRDFAEGTSEQTIVAFRFC